MEHVQLNDGITTHTKENYEGTFHSPGFWRLLSCGLGLAVDTTYFPLS